jgi:hypothetical protein
VVADPPFLVEAILVRVCAGWGGFVFVGFVCLWFGWFGLFTADLQIVNG